VATIVDHARFVEIQKRRARVIAEIAQLPGRAVVTDEPHQRTSNGAVEAGRPEPQSTVERKEPR
jgi:hypothetical protein